MLYWQRIFYSIALLAACLACSTPAAQTVEEQIQAIEHSNVTDHWSHSQSLIDELESSNAAIPDPFRFRIGLIKLRNLALAGDHAAAQAFATELLRQPSTVELRVKALILAVNVLSNAGDYPLAFARLQEGLDLSDQIDDVPPRLLGMAAYLYERVGEESLALDYAKQSLDAARALGEPRQVCIALSVFANGLNHMRRLPESELTRREQIDVCKMAEDPVFLADAYKGLGMAMIDTGRPQEALVWLREARTRFEASGYSVGKLETDLRLAQAMLHSGAASDQIQPLLDESLPAFQKMGDTENLELAWRLSSELAERMGKPEVALDHLRRAEEARRDLAADVRKRRLSFLQVQFDTRAKEHQIVRLQDERERQAEEIRVRSRTQWLQAIGLLTLLLVAALLVSLLARTSGERRRFRELSERDGLTGLYNHQNILRLGRHLQVDSQRGLRPFTTVVADIDHFKQINDRFGHATGDAVLKNLGQLLRAVMPERAVVGRSGGEEFTMLIDATSEQTRFLIEDLRRRIQPLTVFGERVDYSLSYGLCEASASHAPLEDILRTADDALYHAKRSGRDRVVDAASLPSISRQDAGLVVVGSGIQLGRHLSQRCLSEIETAERVLAVTDGAAFAMIAELRPDVIDLRSFYGEGKDRRQTYREMEEAILAEVREGRRVCAVFYGHPGVFADVPHAVIKKAREAGYSARMEPGVSSEACLYADLGIDPGRHGVQSLEATQFLVEERQLDTRGLVLLWQVALTGDLACQRFHAEPAELEKLVVRLLLDYPADHEVILYEAARLPVETFRAERLPLQSLPKARFQEYTTLVIPPSAAAFPDLTARLVPAREAVTKPT